MLAHCSYFSANAGILGYLWLKWFISTYRAFILWKKCFELKFHGSVAHTLTPFQSRVWSWSDFSSSLLSTSCLQKSLHERRWSRPCRTWSSLCRAECRQRTFKTGIRPHRLQSTRHLIDVHNLPAIVVLQEECVRVVAVNGVHGKHFGQAACLHKVVAQLVVGCRAHQVAVVELEVNGLHVRVLVEPVPQRGRTHDHERCHGNVVGLEDLVKGALISWTRPF